MLKEIYSVTKGIPPVFHVFEGERKYLLYKYLHRLPVFKHGQEHQVEFLRHQTNDLTQQDKSQMRALRQTNIFEFI